MHCLTIFDPGAPGLPAPRSPAPSPDPSPPVSPTCAQSRSKESPQKDELAVDVEQLGGKNEKEGLTKTLQTYQTCEISKNSYKARKLPAPNHRT